MQIEKLDPEHTALLFFDLLNGHVKENFEIIERYQPVIKNAVRLLTAAREADMMIAFAAANHRADGKTSARLVRDTDNKLRPITDQDNELHAVVGGTMEAQVIAELAPRPQDYLVLKYRWNAFYQTYLDLALRNRNVNTLVISGGSTDVGVASTAFAARDMDYNLVMVSDACSSHTQDNHDQFMKRIFPRMGRVRTTDQVLKMINA